MKINAKKKIFNFFIILIVLCGGAYSYYNPTILNFLKKTIVNEASLVNNNSVNDGKIELLEKEIGYLRSQVLQVPNFNLKADSATVMSLQASLTSLEDDVKALKKDLTMLSKKTTNNALVLTSALMLKQDVLLANSFETQVFLLNNLLVGNKVMADDIKLINSIKIDEIKSNTQLVDDFNVIYKQLVAEQKNSFEEASKSKISTKLDDFIKLIKINDKDAEFIVDENLESTKNLVNAKEFYPALKNIQNFDLNNTEINEKLNHWMNNVITKQKMLKAIDNIIANSVIAINLKEFNKE